MSSCRVGAQFPSVCGGRGPSIGRWISSLGSLGSDLARCTEIKRAVKIPRPPLLGPPIGIPDNGKGTEPGMPPSWFHAYGLLAFMPTDRNKVLRMGSQSL